MPVLKLPSFAKINLSLEVIGRRTDGYHELRTIFQSLALHDTLTFSPGRGVLRIASTDPDVPTDERNLVWKAARALWEEGGRRGEPGGIRVHLHKRIPAQAGLGGGSSNAAVTLLALNRLWKLRLPGRRLGEMAATLGADVPFFLLGGTALGLGRGEELYPMPDIPRTAVVLVKPPFGVATAAAYTWLENRDCPLFLQPAESQPAQALGRLPKNGEGPRFPVGWFPGTIPLANVLEAPVAAHHPEIGGIRDALLKAGALAAHLCGSGSTVFGLFDSVSDARAAADRLAWPRHLVAVTSTLGRAPYSRRLAPVGLPVR